MSKKHIYMSDLHFENKSWKREIDFEKEELNFFRGRLEEVVSGYTDKDVLAKAEQFQNKMIRHREVLDTLLHDINEQEDKLIKFALEHPIATDHIYFSDHGTMRDRVETQRRIYSEFKNKFFRYLMETL